MVPLTLIFAVPVVMPEDATREADVAHEGEAPEPDEPAAGRPDTGEAGELEGEEPAAGDPETGLAGELEGEPEAGELQAGEFETGEPEEGEPEVKDPEAGELDGEPWLDDPELAPGPQEPPEAGEEVAFTGAKDAVDQAQEVPESGEDDAFTGEEVAEDKTGQASEVETTFLEAGFDEAGVEAQVGQVVTGFVRVHGQSVTVSVVASVTVQVLSPCENVVADGQ